MQLPDVMRQTSTKHKKARQLSVCCSYRVFSRSPHALILSHTHSHGHHNQISTYSQIIVWRYYYQDICYFSAARILQPQDVLRTHTTVPCSRNVRGAGVRRPERAAALVDRAAAHRAAVDGHSARPRPGRAAADHGLPGLPPVLVALLRLPVRAGRAVTGHPRRRRPAPAEHHGRRRVLSVRAGRGCVCAHLCAARHGRLHAACNCWPP